MKLRDRRRLASLTAGCGLLLLPRCGAIPALLFLPPSFIGTSSHPPRRLPPVSIPGYIGFSVHNASTADVLECLHAHLRPLQYCTDLHFLDDANIIIVSYNDAEDHYEAEWCLRKQVLLDNGAEEQYTLKDKIVFETIEEVAEWIRPDGLNVMIPKG